MKQDLESTIIDARNLNSRNINSESINEGIKTRSIQDQLIQEEELNLSYKNLQDLKPVTLLKQDKAPSKANTKSSFFINKIPFKNSLQKINFKKVIFKQKDEYRIDLFESGSKDLNKANTSSDISLGEELKDIYQVLREDIQGIDLNIINISRSETRYNIYSKRVVLVIIFLSVFIGTYIGYSLFGVNSLEVLFSLYDKKDEISKQVQDLQAKNALLHKKYLELQELEPEE